MDLTAYVDDTLRRRPEPLPTPNFTWWPAWAMPCRDAGRDLLVKLD